MKQTLLKLLLLPLLGLALWGCIDRQEHDPEGFDWSAHEAGDGLFVVNEGNFMYGNASLSYYVPSTGKSYREVFYRANGEVLGDVAQSMTIRNGRGYIVVNNSGVVFIIDIDTFEVVGTVDNGLLSPRYIHFVDDTKAYLTDLYASRITIFDPRTGFVKGRIETPGHASTEQMVQYGQYVFVNCWSYDNTILVIDTATDSVVDKIEVGLQPTSLVLDKYGKIWTVTDGGYDGSPFGWEAPALYRIDAASRTIEKRFVFATGAGASEVCLDGAGETLYFINQSVWKMSVLAEELPIEPFLSYNGTKYYGLAVNPYNSDVYVADAIDYVQSGVVYRFSAEGEQLDTFRAGIIPGAFCFRQI